MLRKISGSNIPRTSGGPNLGTTALALTSERTHCSGYGSVFNALLKWPLSNQHSTGEYSKTAKYQRLCLCSVGFSCERQAMWVSLGQLGLSHIYSSSSIHQLPQFLDSKMLVCAKIWLVPITIGAFVKQYRHDMKTQPRELNQPDMITAHMGCTNKHLCNDFHLRSEGGSSSMYIYLA